MPEFETHSQHACCRCSWRFPFPWSPQKNWLVMKLSWITECRKRNTNSADRQCWCSGLWCKLPLAFRTVPTMHMQVAWNTHPRRPVNPTWYREKMGEVRRHQKTMYIVYTMYRYVQVIMINFVGFCRIMLNKGVSLISALFVKVLPIFREVWRSIVDWFSF